MKTLRQILIGACLFLSNPVPVLCDDPTELSRDATDDLQEANDSSTKNEEAARDEETLEADRGDPKIADLMWYAIVWLAPNREAAFLVATNYGSGFAACDEAIGGLIAELDERNVAQ